MGPDCGTAVVGGVGLGFAHTLQRGPVGLVAASGTGAQQLLCLLDAAGVGISAALGVGGRDLSEPVAGRSSLAALGLLDEDPATELILVVSKPPAGPVAERLRSRGGQLPAPRSGSRCSARARPDLTAAAEAALGELGRAGAGLAALAGRRPTAAERPTGLAARAVLRRHAVRRGDADRQRRRSARSAPTSRCGRTGRCRNRCDAPVTA